MEKKGFLEHLAGLRGVAIILVMLFHLNASTWGHGYLGVDVFLVMTGYLLFRSRLAKGAGPTGLRESAAFLCKRVQRIVPPMLLLIIGTILAGMLFLWWQDELFSGKVGFAACLGKANLMLKREFDDYFANDSAFVPLLHLWYLSVTLQIYLIYAVGNLLMERLPRRVLVWGLALVGGASLAYAYAAPLLEWLSAQGLPTWEGVKRVSYYQTLPRLWEVLAGGLVCVLPGLSARRWLADLATIGGLLCILLPALAGSWLPAEFPGTLAVVAGAVLTLRYAPESRAYPLLSNKPLVLLGGISFSLYLVHMPIIVFMRMWVYGEPGAAYSVLILGVALAAAVGFYHGIEKRRFPWWLILLLWCVTFFLSRTTRKTEGFRAYAAPSQWELPAYEQWRLCEHPETTRDFRAEKFPLFDGVFRVMNQTHRQPGSMPHTLLAMGSDERPTCLLIGDSHAAHSYAGLDTVLRQEGISGAYLASYIYPLHGWEEDRKPNYKQTPPREVALFEWLSAHPEITHIIIGQRWWVRLNTETDRHTQDLRLFLTRLRDLGKSAVILGPTPEFGPQAALLHYDKIFSLQGITSTEAEQQAATCTKQQYLHTHATALRVLRQMQDEGLCRLIEPLDTLPEGELFRSLQGGVLMMTDANHMSVGMSRLIMQQLRHQLRAALTPATP